MRSKIPIPWPLLILGIVILGSAATIIFFLCHSFPERDFYAHSTVPMGAQVPQGVGQAGSGFPIRLKIPAINVDASIEDVGLTPQGAMGVPAGPTSTAWFDLGPRPGEDGSAVIAGHEGWKDGIRAVFDDLHQLRIGDRVYVGDTQNATTTFVVSGIQTYDQNGDAVNIFSSNDGKAHLNLVTCEGTWNAAEKSYSGRLVVFTEKE